MRFILVLTTLLFLSSCLDAPRTRSTGATSSDAVNYTTYTTDTTTSDSLEDDSSTSRSTTDTEETTASSIPTEIDHCSWSTDGSTGFASEHSHLGKFTVCQSRSSDTDIYVQLENAITDSQLCLIPTYNSGSRSIYIGEPRCIYVQEDANIYKVEMLKNRTGYTNFSITGVMMMKDKMYRYAYPYGNPYRWMLSVDAYLYCANILDQSGDTRYCQAFSNVGQYVYNEF